MPFCISRYTVLVARRTGGSTCRLVSANAGQGRVSEFAGDATLKPAPAGNDYWTNYVRGVVAQYVPELPGAQCGFEAAIISTVPLGGGLSSSASLEVATATMLEAVYGLKADPVDKALRCQKCEHTFCGMPCGIMDQFVSACGHAGHALLIDCRPPYATVQVPLADPNLALLVANSNVKHELSGSEYPDRVRQCKEAAKAMGVAYLRDATLEKLDRVAKNLPERTVARARHGISEDQRTQQAKTALIAGDYALVGKLMFASHASLRDDFEVSTPELDALVDIAKGVDGVYGSRMTGGGFGGCTVTLLRAEALPALLAAIASEYPKRSGGKQATCFSTSPARGAFVLQQDVGIADPGNSKAWKYAAAGVLAGVLATTVVLARRQ
jgi:galactokinase